MQLVNTQHRLLIATETRPGDPHTWWRGTCSCGYRGRLYGDPDGSDRAAKAANDHLNAMTADDPPGPMHNIHRNTPMRERSSVSWTFPDGRIVKRYGTDHGILDVHGFPQFCSGEDDHEGHVHD